MKKLLFTFFYLLFACTGNTEYKNPLWEIGQTVEYKVKSKNWGEYKLTYSIFGKENNNYWLELKGNKENKTLFVFQFLTPIYFKGKIVKQILKIENQPAVLLEGELAHDIPMNIPLKIILKDNVNNGNRTKVKTANAMFKAIQYVENGDTLWVNYEIPITGIIKISGNEKWELIKYSNSGAKSSITEQPIKPKINF